MVPGVEELTAKLEPHALADVRVLDGRKIPVVEAGSEEAAGAFAAKVINGGFEGVGGEPGIDGFGHVDRGDLVRTRVGRAEADVYAFGIPRVAGLLDGEILTGEELRDTGNLPAAGDLTYKALLVLVEGKS